MHLKHTIVKFGFIMALLASKNVIAETPVSLRVDASLPYCTFDKTYDTPQRIAKNTLRGSFNVQCQDQARPFRLASTLSPFAHIDLNDNSAYTVEMYVREGGWACAGDVIHKDATALHSGNRSVRLIGLQEDKKWSYCVQLTPTKGDSVPEMWPLQGELAITLMDAQKGWLLPENASRINVRFEHNSSALGNDIQVLLDTLLSNIIKPNDYHVQLHAHTSTVGDAQYNHELSIMRLMRVRNYIVKKSGIPKKNTWGQAWGETRPAALNTIENEETQNRRVDIILLPKADAKLSNVEVMAAPRIIVVDQ
jgi:outer membrane protein OmpA-like peptidoglycan-associated protein